MIAALVLLLSPAFPPAINAHLSLGYEPQCTLCHETLVGGLGTVTRPFGQTAIARGLVAADTISLETALDAMAAEGTDSDSDGVGDIAELQAGTNPNGGEGPEPEFGCFGRIGGASPPAFLLLAALAFTWGLTPRARRRR